MLINREVILEVAEYIHKECDFKVIGLNEFCCEVGW